MSRKKRMIPRVGRSSLSIIACLLIGSGLIRIAAGADEAWAKAEEHFQKPPAVAMSQVEEHPAVASTQVCKTEEDLKAMLVAFEDREQQLKRREERIQERMEALALADREITVRVQEMERIEQELSRTLAIADQAAERDIDKLVTVYENMKPKDAAALFEEMAPNFAAGFLAKMQPEAAAGVMAGLSPNAAYTISVVLAGRNAEGPKE